MFELVCISNQLWVNLSLAQTKNNEDNFDLCGTWGNLNWWNYCNFNVGWIHIYTVTCVGLNIFPTFFFLFWVVEGFSGLNIGSVVKIYIFSFVSFSQCGFLYIYDIGLYNPRFSIIRKSFICRYFQYSEFMRIWARQMFFGKYCSVNLANKHCKYL